MKRIRAHHCVCIAYWKGKGYSRSFEQNMTCIVFELHAFPDEKVQIIDHCDDICGECPHMCRLPSPHCLSEDKKRTMDIKASEKLNISIGDIITSSELLSLEKRLTSEMWEEICSQCSWHNFCLQIRNSK